MSLLIAFHESANVVVHELVKFINTNDRTHYFIEDHFVNYKEFTAKLFTYFVKKVNFQNLKINDEASLFKVLADSLKLLEQDTYTLKKLKKLAEHGMTEADRLYDDFAYFSIDIDSLLDKVELKLFDTKELKKASKENSIFNLDWFDPLLYTKIITSPQLLHAITWREFEYILAKILATFEYEVELQKGSHDNGIDIIAIKRNDMFGEHKYLIQAKKWKDKVGVEPIQRLAFLHDHYNV